MCLGITWVARGNWNPYPKKQRGYLPLTLNCKPQTLNQKNLPPSQKAWNEILAHIKCWDCHSKKAPGWVSAVPSNDLPLSDPCQDCFLLFTISQGAMLTQDYCRDNRGQWGQVFTKDRGCIYCRSGKASPRRKNNENGSSNHWLRWRRTTEVRCSGEGWAHKSQAVFVFLGCFVIVAANYVSSLPDSLKDHHRMRTPEQQRSWQVIKATHQRAWSPTLSSLW
jgi:hypothetical protein